MNTISASSMSMGASSASMMTGYTGSAPASANSAMLGSQQSSMMVGEHVDSFLGAVDPAQAGNELLKMSISLLIMKFLLGKEDDKNQDQSMMSMALLAALGGGSQSTSMHYSSQTTTMNAADAYAGTGGQSAGSNVNVTA